MTGGAGACADFCHSTLAAQQGTADIASFLPLLKHKAKKRLPLARRIVIVTDQENLGRACVFPL